MTDPVTRAFVGGPYDGTRRKISTDECTAHGHAGGPVTYRLVGEDMVAGGKPKATPSAFPATPAKTTKKVGKKAAAKGGE